MKFNWDKYYKLTSEAGLDFFDDHGACFNCVNDLVDEYLPCTCVQEQVKQAEIMKICRGEENA